MARQPTVINYFGSGGVNKRPFAGKCRTVSIPNSFPYHTLNLLTIIKCGQVGHRARNCRSREQRQQQSQQ